MGRGWAQGWAVTGSVGRVVEVGLLRFEIRSHTYLAFVAHWSGRRGERDAFVFGNHRVCGVDAGDG